MVLILSDYSITRDIIELNSRVVVPESLQTLRLESIQRNIIIVLEKHEDFQLLGNYTISSLDVGSPTKTLIEVQFGDVSPRGIQA